MKLFLSCLLALSCGLTAAHPLIADVLKAESMQNRMVGSMMVDPLYEEANYRFQYEVKDAESGNDFGHEEARMGDVATGSYHVLLPDGRLQRVDYVADSKGFRPMVQYEGEAMYGSQAMKGGSEGIDGMAGY